jgi:hypothetical protein
MQTVVEIATLAGAPINEDRAGAAGTMAWVIDGATDVVEAPLTLGPTDASWAAETLHETLGGIAGEDIPTALTNLPAVLSERLAAEFARVALRQPRGRHEHPCASGLIARFDGRRLDYVAVGDCTLVAVTSKGIVRLGTEDADAGDPWVAKAVAQFHARQAAATAAEARAAVWPKIINARKAMNEPDGYGVLSITPTPPHFIKAGTVEVAAGGYALLASDGLMRLIDIFGRYASVRGLLEAAATQGLARLLEDVRAAETEDTNCVRFPRAKVHDDATGVLIRIS